MGVGVDKKYEQNLLKFGLCSVGGGPPAAFLFYFFIIPKQFFGSNFNLDKLIFDLGNLIFNLDRLNLIFKLCNHL